MKPTDETINQALQKALKRRFDSFEVQPSSRLSSEVLGTIIQPNFSNFKRFSAILILVITGSLGLLQFWPEPENATPAKIHSVVKKSGTGTFSHFEKSAPTIKTKQVSLPTTLLAESSDQQTRTVKNTQSESLELKPIHVLPIQVPDDPKKSFHQPRTVLKQTARNSDIYPHSSRLESTEPAVKTQKEKILYPRLDDANPIESLNQSLSTRLAIDIKKLQPHPLRTNRPIPTPSPEILAQNPASRSPQTSLSHWRGIISFAPTNTYQRLTVLPQMHVQYQNFELPSLFSVRTAGFNLSGGIEKQGFQVVLNYSRFTQKIAYEIALDEYLVQSQGMSAYTIAREGKSQLEEITFQLVGLSLQKKFSLPTRSLSGFFVYTGTSLSHDLTTSHNLAWGTVGMGKSWPVASAASLSLIPQLSLGLNTVKTNNDAFKNRFYQIGMAVELTFGKK